MQAHNRRNTQNLSRTKLRAFSTLLLEMQFDPIAIGSRIKQARLEAGGLTQEQLASLGSFSYRSLQDWEAGSRIPFKHLAELGKLLNKSADWFLYGDEPVLPESDAMARYEKVLTRIGEVEQQQRELLGVVRDLLERLPRAEVPPDDGQ
jgi:transcriptional regulator with XRE-family HTH domain